jgi:hypothetical protein
MSFTLNKVVPWGRSLKEYISMFALSDQDLRKSILGCGDGPASFNAELTRKGGEVISIDPIYQFSAPEIQARISETYDQIIEQTTKNIDEFNWEHIKSVEELGKKRMAAMALFLEDFATLNKRYITAELPALPFTNKKFELALCSHLLFLYSEQMSLDFHLQAIQELCRVAQEVRIFPLLELGANKSRYLEGVLNSMNHEGFKCEMVQV